MDHHYHLLIGTPEADLSAGMQAGEGRQAGERFPYRPAGSGPAHRLARLDDQPDAEETLKLKT
jgi:hypothetical protein